MNLRKAIAAAPVAMLLLVGSLAACSDANEIPGAASSDSATSTQNAGPQQRGAAIAAAVSKDAQASAKLPGGLTKITVGSNLQSPPATFLAADGKTPVGFEVDLINAVGKRLGVEVSIQNMQFDTLISSLQSKRVDLTIASMNDNKTREKAIDFVTYFNSGMSIMVKKGNPSQIKGPEDLCGKKVNMAPGSSQEAWVNQVNPTLCKGKDPIAAIPNTSDQQRLNDLKLGRVDAQLNDLPNVSYIAQTSGNGNDFEAVAAPPINGAPYGIGFNKESIQLRDATQAAVQSLIDDGTYAKILDVWGVADGALKNSQINAGS
ncbi:ABC transporter substrate-binding protein [Dactylosporangium sp. NPDC000521]|uniref:ABC transporter substrate-binding protein n=1 Tax=Dactylosporangium sp. NPDC000521 TaxID=3363975 RepID=UPI00369C36F2